MAEGGHEIGVSVKDSEYFYDFPCFPCTKDGKNVEANKYCSDCDENMCTSCLVLHNRFALTRGHKVLDQVQTHKRHRGQLPTHRCSKHGGKIIDLFCPGDDTVGCSTCISVNHSSCKDRKFIPDVAVGIKTSKELKQLETELKSLKSKLDTLKKLKGDNLHRLKRDKDALKREIQSVRTMMNEQLDKMENELVKETDAKFKPKIEAIHTSIAEVDTMLAKVKHALALVNSNSNDADIFVSCKVAKQELSKEIIPLHACVDERPTERSFELHIDENSKLILEHKNMFASIKEKYTILKAEYKGDNTIHMSDDNKQCRVYAMCALPDGCIAVSDHWNKKLKKLDPISNNVSVLINLPDNPYGVCLVDNTHIVVSLLNTKELQFVSLSGQVKLDKSFPVGDRCRGVAHCDGLLYVCCGGDARHEEGCGHVEVYNCTGELLRCLYEELCCPQSITVLNNGCNTTMYISDAFKGVHIRGMDGAVKHSFQTFLKTDLPFSLIGTDQICIGEYFNGNIHLHTYKDKGILIQKHELNGKPTCLYFDEISSRLFVALLNCDDIKEFHLIIK